MGIAGHRLHSLLALLVWISCLLSSSAMRPASHSPLAPHTGDTEPRTEEEDRTALAFPMHRLGISQVYRWSIILAAALLIVLVLGPTTLLIPRHWSTLPVRTQSLPANTNNIVSLEATMQSKRGKKDKKDSVSAGDIVSPEAKLCDAAANDMKECMLIISLRNNVSVAGLHMFARKYKASKQVEVIEYKKQVVLTYPGKEIDDCCNAYKELSPAPVVKSVQLIEKAE